MMIPPSDTDYARALLAHPPSSDPAAVQHTISALSLQAHIEGGFFAETDRDKLLVPNPFQNLPLLANATSRQKKDLDTSATRSASTTIFYLVAPTSPVGYFHRNRARTVHTLHRGRGRYVILHVDRRDDQGRVPVESFVVGQDVERGEKLQWIVEGGKFKASFLLPDTAAAAAATTTEAAETGVSEKGLLISETVVPGFEYSDHDFLTAEGMVEYLDPKEIEELRWLLKRGEQDRLDEALKSKKK
ncbi:hypothetical protein PV08_10127 [Exophiala spinifera]|uniref:DUF985 domain-containing protein n=1 Tax=Exophiala spinifera TaxID=91928 RepID=A0A0D2AVR0_9EURO|nr:uncharacterized protein PV08_10127 [Exophiala spinifera]KIW10828.1 hypothetical protein PV08_10127 [Exophiala spinifera]